MLCPALLTRPLPPVRGRYFKNFNVAQQQPTDGMHLTGDGITSYDGYYCFYSLIRAKILSLEAINERLRTAPKSTWPDGIRVRDMHSNVKKGRLGGLPRKDGRLRYTASKMNKFALARCAPTFVSSHRIALLACLPA